MNRRLVVISLALWLLTNLFELGITGWDFQIKTAYQAVVFGSTMLLGTLGVSITLYSVTWRSRLPTASLRGLIDESLKSHAISFVGFVFFGTALFWSMFTFTY